MTYVRRLLPDHVFNPLHTGKHFNKPCICGSGKKVKKCCGVEVAIKKDLAVLVFDAMNEKYFSHSEFDPNNKAERKAYMVMKGIEAEVLDDTDRIMNEDEPEIVNDTETDYTPPLELPHSELEN